MSIRERTYVEIRCDVRSPLAYCRQSFADKSITAARQGARLYGWATLEDGRHACPGCRVHVEQQRGAACG